MAVRLGKYYIHINDGVRKYILCAKTFVQCAEMFSPCNIYINGAPKHLYECANILGLPRKCFGLRGNILACAEIFSLSAEMYSLPAENYMLRQNIFKSHTNLLFARGNYYVPTILGMPECRD